MADNPIVTAIEAMTPEQQRGALTVLDMLTRPLTVREIENALKAKGVPRSRAVVTAASVKNLAIIAMIGGES